MRLSQLTALLVVAGFTLLLGCGENREQRPLNAQTERAGDQRSARQGPSRTPASPTTEAALPPRLSCPLDAGNCASARGRILYVEAVDPDGDGDAHFVLASKESITLPGISVIDVGINLRPEPLPVPGDYLSAVGPVYPGSYGQRQIEATAIRYSRQAKRP